MENSMRNLVMIDLNVVADEIVKGIRKMEILVEDTPEEIYEQMKTHVLNDLEGFSTEGLQAMIVLEYGSKVVKAILSGGIPSDY